MSDLRDLDDLLKGLVEGQARLEKRLDDMEKLETPTSAPAHALVSATHTASGLTIGQPLRATSATAFDFGTLAAAAYGALSVGTAALADLAVTTGKLADLGVTTAKLALLGVTTAIINDLAITTGKLAANAVSFAKLVASAAGLSVVGRSANTAGDFAEIVAASDGQVLRRAGTALGFGALDLAIAAAITGILPHANHGIVWTTWTPQLYQNGNLTSTVTYARYATLGKIAFVQVKLVCTQAGTAGNAIIVTNIPAAIAPVRVGSLAACGSGVIRRAAIINYACTVYANGATDFNFVTGANNGDVGALPSFALANTDLITIDAMYEIA